jgi:hypothetical protein
MALYLFSFDAASPFANFDSGSGSLVTGRHGFGCNPSSRLTKITGSTASISSGFAAFMGDFSTELVQIAGRANTQINAIVVQLSQLGDGRLQIGVNSPNFFGVGNTAPTTTVMLKSGWSFIEMKVDWDMVVTADPANPATKSFVKYEITPSVYVNNVLTIIPTYMTITTNSIANALVPEFVKAGTFQVVNSRYATIDDWYIDDAGTIYGDSYAHSDDATLEVVSATKPAITQAIAELLLSPANNVSITQGVAEILLSPLNNINNTQHLIEVMLFRRFGPRGWKVKEVEH